MKRRMRELTKGKGRTNIMEERRESRENLIKAKENSRMESAEVAGNHTRIYC